MDCSLGFEEIIVKTLFYIALLQVLSLSCRSAGNVFYQVAEMTQLRLEVRGW